MKQYLELCQRIVDEGHWVENKRTGIRCLTVINADLEYDVGNNRFPLITTRKSFYKAAIAELLGYLRGYDNAAQFREIGCNTWNANANENSAWLNNPHRKGEDDMGRVYGEPYESPTLNINPNIKSLEDIETWVTTDDFEVVGYQHHDAIKYPFAV